LVAAGLTLGLIGSGISASWADNGTASQNISVGTFEIEIGSTVPGAVVVNTPATHTHTVSYTAADILGSPAGTRPLPFSVKSLGSIPITVHVTMTTPLAPFTSMLAAPVADVSLAQGESHEYLGGLQWPELGNPDQNKLATITYTASVVEGPSTVIAVAPTVVPQSAGLTNGGINIPAVVDAQYSIAGVPVSAGFNQRALGTYQVTMVATGGHLLTGYPTGGWSLTVADAANVRAITISQMTTYSWNGNGSKVAGPVPVVDNVAHTVTYVIPINTSATPTVSGIVYSGPSPVIGNYTYTTTGTTVIVRATATKSAGLSGGTMNLVYRRGVSGISFGNVPGGTLNVAAPGPNLVTIADRHQGGANGLFTDNAPGVMWSGVTGSGTVTIVLTFSATTP
jgi:hypothetical protein